MKFPYKYICLLIPICLLCNCVQNDLGHAHKLLAAGEFVEARDIYITVVKRKPFDFNGHYGLGMTYSAEAIYKTQLGLADIDDWYPAIYQVSLAMNLGGGEEVQKTLAILHYNLGAAYRKLGNNLDAVSRLEQAITYDSTLLKALNLLGAVYHETGILDKAQRCYGQAIAVYPDYAMAHFNLGAVSWAQGDYASALMHFNKACEISSDNGYFKNWRDKAQSRIKKSERKGS